MPETVAEPTEAAKPVAMTEAEYLAFEETAELRHEYRDGRVYAMSGGTYEHSLIGTNVSGAVRDLLKGKPCRVLNSDMRVLISNRGRYVYPDVPVVCGKPEFPKGDVNRLTLLNPAAVFEVLSPSTEAGDRGWKFDSYRDLPSLRLYVLVASEKPVVTAFTRHENGLWSIDLWEGLDAVADLPALDIRLPLAELYADVDFSEPADEEPPADA